MIKSLFGILAASILLVGPEAVAAESSSILIQGHAKIADDEVVFRFTCGEVTACKIVVGDFQCVLTPGKNIVQVQIESAKGTLEFFDETDVAIVKYGRLAKVLSIFDPTDEAFVKNGANTAIGYLKLSVTHTE